MSTEIISKKCSICEQSKTLSEFGKSSRNKDGLKGQCKECRRAEWSRYSKSPLGKKTKEKYYIENKTHIAHIHKEYRKNNKEHLATKAKEWQIKNKDRVDEKRREYVANNRERVNEKNKRWSRSEQGVKYGKAYREENKEKFAA